MQRETIETLSRINRRFYRRHGGAFDSSRRTPWPGWRRLLGVLAEAGAERPLRVLDAGCGNGRFGHFLASAWQGPIDYLGVDTSEELLAAARRRLAGRLARLELRREDLLDRGGQDPGIEEDFDLVVLFGVLHHIPAEKRRGELLGRLAARLASGGRLAVSVWRFDRDPRLAAKTVAWDELEGLALDPGDLEPGDHLLTWAGDRRFPRYCHLTDEAEVERLLASLPLPCTHRFADDGPSGDSNHYLLLHRPGYCRHRALVHEGDLTDNTAAAAGGSLELHEITAPAGRGWTPEDD